MPDRETGDVTGDVIAREARTGMGALRDHRVIKAFVAWIEPARKCTNKKIVLGPLLIEACIRIVKNRICILDT